MKTLLDFSFGFFSILIFITFYVNCESEKEEQPDASKIDLGKLISSGKPLSIKTTETDTLDEKGNTEKRIKEISIDSLGSQGKEDASSNKEESQLDNNKIANLVSALKTGLSNTSLANLKSPLSAAKGPLTKYPSINELSKENNNNNDSSAEPGSPSAVSAQPPSNETSTSESESVSADSSHVPGNHSETHSETEGDSQTGSSDASHTSNNETTGQVSSDSLPAASNEAPHPQSSGNQTAAEMTGDSTSSASKPSQSQGNQIALVPVSLPSALISQLQNAMNGTQAASASNVSSSHSASSLSPQNATNSPEKGLAEANGNDTVNSKTESNLLANTDEGRLLASSQKTEHGNGQGVIFLANILSNNENSAVKENATPEGYKRYGINISYQEEPDEDY